MPIIGIGGKARNGKDTVADYLVDKYEFTKIGFTDALYEECRNCYIKYYKDSKGHNNFLINRARYIEPSIGIVNWIKKNGTKEKFEGYYYNGMTEKDPILMQWWETDFRRKQDEEYWVKKVRDKIGYIELANSKPQNGTSIGDRMIIKSNIVIPDTRFKNETKMIKEFGGEVWKVERYDKKLEIEFHTNWETMQEFRYIDPSRNSNHPSETDLDSYIFDETISAQSGDLDSLYRQVDKIVEKKLC